MGVTPPSRGHMTTAHVYSPVPWILPGGPAASHTTLEDIREFFVLFLQHFINLKLFQSKKSTDHFRED